jgi:type IV pilus assembly protein PilB
MAYKRLGDMLLEGGYITQEQLDHALAQQAEDGKRLGEMLIEQRVITERELIEVLRTQLGIDFVDLSDRALPPELTRVVPRNIARKHNVVPVSATPDEVHLAMSDPLNFIAQEEVRAAAHRRVVPMVSTREGIERAIAQLYGNEGAARAIEDMRSEAAERGEEKKLQLAETLIDEDNLSNAPTIRLVDSIIERAIVERASDIHVEPRREDLRIRMRIDGIMHNVLTVPRELQDNVISRLKIMGGMDITERRIPQDGRANVHIRRKDIDLRMSTLPTIYGESVVLRLLDKDFQLLEAEDIGLSGNELEKFDRLLHTNNGVILIVGPSGAGKSSTMYTMIRSLNTEQTNLITLEDPVEYHIDGVNQVQINEKLNMTFGNGLRSILRQDPDIIAVGEIRDGETAEIAMRAAITGHLVLSTVHTHDAPSTIDRLIDIGVEPYLIAAGIRGVISQRLVRRICPHCKEKYTPNPEELDVLGLADTEMTRFYRGRGCPMCFHTGYRGRTAVFEILIIDGELRRLIAQDDNHDEIAAHLHEMDYTPLARHCIELVLDGTTTLEEAARTINSLE